MFERSPRLAAALAAVALTAGIHGAVLNVHLWFDDLTDLRPWSADQLAGVLTGTWDPLGVSELYHRPLTAFYQAVLFPVFGLNTAALHAVSLALVAAVAWLIGLFVWRETQRAWLAVSAMVVLVAHPALPDAASAWVHNQYHLIGCLTAAIALLIWQRVRRQPAQRWWPLWVMIGAGFYVKEDNLMVLPALLVAQWIRARLTRDLPSPSRGVLASAAGLVVILIAVRLAAFPYFTFASVDWLDGASLSGWLWAYGSGPYHTLVRIQTASPIWANIPGVMNVPASLAVSTLFALGVVAIVRRPRSPDNALFLLGLCLVAVLGLPLALATGPTRIHLVVFGAALTLAGGAGAVAPLFRHPFARAMAAILAVAAALPLITNVRATNEGYQPCSDHELRALPLMMEIEPIPDDLRQYLLSRPARCAAGEARPPVEAQGAVFWNVSAWMTDASGVRFRWTSDHAVALIRRRATGMTLTIRHPGATLQSPIAVVISTDGDRDTRFELRSPEWQDIHVDLKPGIWTRLRDSFRIDLRVTTAAAVTPRGLAIQAARIDP